MCLCTCSPPDGPKRPSVSVSPSAEIVEGSSVTLTCSSDANPAARYTWNKENVYFKPPRKGPQLVFSSILSSDSGQYSCTAENELGTRTSQYRSIDVKYGPERPSVSVSPSAEIVEGSSVTLTCSSDANPAAKYTWYKENVYFKHLSEGPHLVFSSILSSDSGQYYCTAENKLGTKTSQYKSIDVKYGPKRPSVSVSPSAEIVEGSSVTLTCSSDANPAAKYTWNKGNVKVKPPSEGPQLVFSSILSSDSGQYYCTAENKLGTKVSQYTSVDVKYAPKVVSLSLTPTGEIRENSRVTLTCSSDANPAATYTWYKDGNPRNKNRPLVFRSILSSDSGQYYCVAVNKLGSRTSKSISIDVKYGPKRLSVSVSPSAEIVEGSSVTLTCSSDANPAATYTWYKNGNPRDKNRQLVFSSIQSSDSGQYYCVAENKLGSRTSKFISIDVKYGPKRPSVSVSPSAEIVEGSSVTLTCSSDANPAANYTWYKENQTLPHGPEGSYNFTSIRSEDRGNYYCKSENQFGQSNSSLFVDVQYGPKRPSVSVSPSAEIVEGSSVTLTCSSDANPAARYTWYKENVKVKHPSEGPQLVFSSILSSDSGQYSCTAENELGRKTSQYRSIDLKYGPKRPSVSVSPSAEIVEGSSVTLTCSSDANPAANHTWYKENQTLPHGPEGSYHFTSIRSEDRGNYYCKSENQFGQSNSSLFIDVQYGPKRPSVSVSPSAEIVEGSSVTLTCSSDANPAANYTWYKENEDSPKASGQIFTITDVRPEHSGDYSCEAQNRRGRQSSTLHLTVVADKLNKLKTCLLCVYMDIFHAVIQGQEDWGVTYTSTHICAVKGSTVDIPCSYTYPSRINGLDTKVEKGFWFTELNNDETVDLTTVSEYSGRVQYHSENNDCTLRISELRERDSAVYKFMFTTNQDGNYVGYPGVTLTVTDSFSCAVRGHEDFPSPSV
ncbi:B-cell receptor CD22, partial [Etheostoma spectabile]|uniref:B-cell receptor CD22 n=1 Tax=Etheostoma spectabile TaxID=54343 RepID=UPI0013AF4415